MLSRRTIATTDAASPIQATGLSIIHASSDTGNVRHRAGCAQYADADRVDAQPNAATPPGTSTCSEPWPPVPGHQFSKCRPPAIRTAAQLTARLAGRPSPDRRRVIVRPARQPTGIAAASAITARRPAAALIATVPTAAGVER